LIFLSLAFTLRRADVLKKAANPDLLEHPLFIQALEMLERIDATELSRD
jgi:hypothetical protein